VSTGSGRPLSLAPGVWIDTTPVRIVGTKLSSTMTVLRLSDGLLLHSPIEMTPERRASVEALGLVRHLYAPNLFHHLHLRDWAEAFPLARVHAPAGLSKKRPDVRTDRVHDSTPEPAFAGTLTELTIDGFRLGECALYYLPAKTLIVADLVHNIGRPDDAWTQFYTKIMGFYDRVALSRALRWTAFSDRRAARQSIDALLSFPFERLVVGHGKPIVAGARDALAAAFAWLPAARG
jgi:hypothetical protein